MKHPIFIILFFIGVGANCQSLNLGMYDVVEGVRIYETFSKSDTIYYFLDKLVSQPVAPFSKYVIEHADFKGGANYIGIINLELSNSQMNVIKKKYPQKTLVALELKDGWSTFPKHQSVVGRISNPFDKKCVVTFEMTKEEVSEFLKDTLSDNTLASQTMVAKFKLPYKDQENLYFDLSLKGLDRESTTSEWLHFWQLRKRSVYFNLSSEFSNIKEYLDQSSLRIKKEHQNGEITEEKYLIDTLPERFSIFNYPWKNDYKDWLTIHYKIDWRFKNGYELFGTWETTDLSVLNIASPLILRKIYIELDSDLKNKKVAKIKVNIFNMTGKIENHYIVYFDLMNLNEELYRELLILKDRKDTFSSIKYSIEYEMTNGEIKKVDKASMYDDYLFIGSDF